MIEYKIIQERTPKDVVDTANQYAKQGWRLDTASITHMPAEEYSKRVIGVLYKEDEEKSTDVENAPNLKPLKNPNVYADSPMQEHKQIEGVSKCIDDKISEIRRLEFYRQEWEAKYADGIGKPVPDDLGKVVSYMREIIDANDKGTAIIEDIREAQDQLIELLIQKVALLEEHISNLEGGSIG